MIRRLLAWVFAILALALTAFAADLPATWRAWRYSRSIQTTDTSGPVKLTIPGTLYSKLANGFADLRIVDETAVFGVFSRRWGVPMSDGTTVRLPRIVGQGRALDMLLTGRAVGADEALAIGLASRKVARGTTRIEAEKLAREIAGFPPLAMTSDRRSAYESFDRSEADAIRREMELSLEARRQEAQKGAVRFASGAGRHGKFERQG